MKTANFLMGFLVLITNNADSIIVVSPNDTLVFLGDSAQLNCSFSEESNLVAWYKDPSLITLGRTPQIAGYEVIGDDGSYEYNLRILETTEDSNDLYKCTNISELTDTATAYLHVITSRPTCYVEPGNLLKSGENATFNCSVDLPKNAPGELVLFKNGNEISREEAQDSTVTVQVTRPDNGAMLGCQLQHFTLPPWRMSTLVCELEHALDVQYLSDFSMTVTPDSNITLGDNVSIHCVADGGNPGTYNMTLSFNDDVILAHKREIHHVLSSVTVLDTANYTCQAFTIFYDDSAHMWIEKVEIIVYYSPKMNPAEQRIFEAVIEDIIDMSCTADGFLTPTITWFDNGDDVILGDDVFINITTSVENTTIVTSTLTVVVADESYYGMYTCAASNNIPPGVGQSFEIVRPGSNTLLIAVTVSLAMVTIAVCAFLGFLYFYKKKYKKPAEPIITDTATESPSTNKAVENDYQLFEEGQGDGLSNAREREETNLSIASNLDTEADRSVPLEEDGAISVVSLGEHNVGSSEGRIQYADLDLEPRPQNLAPVERTEYATLQVPPGNTLH